MVYHHLLLASPPAPPRLSRSARGPFSAAASLHAARPPSVAAATRRRAVLLVGVSVLPLLRLRDAAVAARPRAQPSTVDLVTDKMDFQKIEGMQPEEPWAEPPQLDMKGPPPGNPFAGLLNAVAFIASGVLAGLLGTSQREKKALQSTISAMEIKLAENEAAMSLLRENYEKRLLDEQEAHKKQARMLVDKEASLLGQLASTKRTVTSLNEEVIKERGLVEQLRQEIHELESRIAQAEEDKHAFEGKLREKLETLDIFHDKMAEQAANRKAPLWSHVTILEKQGGGGNTRWRCNFCDHVATSSYSRVQAHLLKQSGHQTAPCKKVTIEILTQLRSEVEMAKRALEKTKANPVSYSVGSASGASASSTANNPNSGKKRRGEGPTTELEKAWANDLRNQLDAKIARSFYSGGLPFNFARNPHFQEAFTFAATHNIPGYKPPGYNKLRTTLLKQEKLHIDRLLNHVKSTWGERGVTICSDGWSDPHRRPLINFVAISEKAPVFYRADNCEGDRKTSSYIFNKLKSVIEEIGPHNVVQVITDNASNCRGAGLLVESEYSTIYWTPCVVHTLNLAMKNICEPKKPKDDDEPLLHSTYNALEWISRIKSDAMMIKKFIMNHGMCLHMFNHFSDLKLLAIAETRFASIVVMLKRFVQVKSALQNMVISPEWDVYKVYKEEVQAAANVKEKILSDVWWDNVKYILKFTAPIYEMIRVADTDSPCLHLIYEMWDSMIENVKKQVYLYEGKELEETDCYFYNIIKEILISRWAKGNNPLHCMAHSLNPRYYSAKWLAQDKNREPPHKDKEVSIMRLKCFRKFFPIEEDLARVKEEYTKFSTCSEEFNDHESINDRWMCTPMAWWTNHGSSIPSLQTLAIKLVSQPASSSCCERNWSTYSFIHSVSRNALTPERAQDLVYTHSNLRLLSRSSDAYKKGESMMWDVGGDAFESLSGVGLLEVANLSIDEPQLQAISFGDVDAGMVNLDDEDEDEE